MISYFKKVNAKEQFFPSWRSIFINPTYLNRRAILNGIKENSAFISGDVLDFGCGDKPYKELFTYKSYIGVDLEFNEGHSIPTENIDYTYDGKKLPFDDNKFDSVFCSEVFEHVFNIEEILIEINRVLKVGGHMLITTPFIWPEHEVPNDYCRYTQFGLKYLLKESGFEIIKIDTSNHFLLAITQLINLYFFSIFSNKFLRLIFSLFSVFPINVIGLSLNFLLPRNKSAYINNLFVVQKIKSR